MGPVVTPQSLLPQRSQDTHLARAFSVPHPIYGGRRAEERGAFREMKYFYVKETENSVEELLNYYIRLGYNPEWIN